MDVEQPKQTLQYGGFYLTFTGRYTHDGQPLYDAHPMSLLSLEGDWYDVAFVGGQWVSYDSETQTYAVQP